ncbi:MAG: SDR family oxidoreductase [Myxococcota bacterium]|jgi:NAD(P)-dependent dehydrogenase (short-subunit alcohol dehydrogenase family)|nr:SDR family oxidoreductase [Myxococcota bacterium]
MKAQARAFRGKVAVVTGGGSGIGRAVCHALAFHGAKVVVTDRSLEAAVHTADELVARGYRAQAEELDIREETAFVRVLTRTRDHHGRLDFLFNVAGISSVCEIRDLDQSAWKAVIETNLMGTIYGSKSAYSLMLRQGHGHIVNVSSAAGFIPQPTTAVYTTTKHAINGFTFCLAAEARELGIDVTLVCPGFVQSNIYDACEVIGTVRRDTLASAVPFTPMDTDKAAARILIGVAKKKGLVVFPFHAQFAILLVRLFPSLMVRLSQPVLRTFRRNRQEGGA